MASPGSDWPGILLATVGGLQGWTLVLGLPKGRDGAGPAPQETHGAGQLVALDSWESAGGPLPAGGRHCGS